MSGFRWWIRVHECHVPHQLIQTNIRFDISNITFDISNNAAPSSSFQFQFRFLTSCAAYSPDQWSCPWWEINSLLWHLPFCDSSSRLWFALHLMRDPQRQRMPLNSVQLFSTVHAVTSSDKLRIILYIDSLVHFTVRTVQNRLILSVNTRVEIRIVKTLQISSISLFLLWSPPHFNLLCSVYTEHLPL